MQILASKCRPQLLGSPLSSCWKLNFDPSALSNSRFTRIGGLICNSSGIVLGSRWLFFLFVGVVSQLRKPLIFSLTGFLYNVFLPLKILTRWLWNFGWRLNQFSNLRYQFAYHQHHNKHGTIIETNRDTLKRIMMMLRQDKIENCTRTNIILRYRSFASMSH